MNAAHDPLRVIMHADMDAFYASVEQRDHPELRGRPLAVGGASARGVVAAASYEARRFGVRSAMPSVEAKRRCPKLTFVRGNMALYKKESARLFEIFRDFSPVVERVSLDEAFLDLTGSARLMGPAQKVGQQLRRKVREVLALPVSVGIAPVKMVAKIASASAKPDGLLEVKAHEVEQFLKTLPVSRIWGVGPVAQERLESLGFEQIGDVAKADDETLQHVLGDWGIEIARLARGEDLREVEPYREAVSYSEEHTFSKDIADYQELEPLIREHAESVARRLRNDRVRAHTVVLKWKSAKRTGPGVRGYPVFTRRTTLLQPTDDGRTIAENAIHLLYRSGPDGAIRLLGVGCTGLTSESVDQLSLFDATTDARRSTLNRTVDQIAERFGKKAIGALARKDREQIGLSMQIKRGDEPDG
ncbi:MAG: DNA polymerase IV [Arenicellales bacterium]|nr:DNA polymerase IV [Arenicellales bacterium]